LFANDQAVIHKEMIALSRHYTVYVPNVICDLHSYEMCTAKIKGNALKGT